jgi:hypothetical protein
MTSPATPPPGGWVELERYFADNQATTSEEALSAAARSAGHSDEAIAKAWARVRANEVAAPVRKQARSIVLWAYIATFVVLLAGMIINNPTTAGGGGIVLMIALALGLGLSRFMVRVADPGAALAVILAGPVIVLVIVAGLCVATGLPIRPFSLF